MCNLFSASWHPSSDCEALGLIALKSLTTYMCATHDVNLRCCLLFGLSYGVDEVEVQFESAKQ